MDVPAQRRYAVHGLAVEVDCRPQWLVEEVRRLLGEFEATAPVAPGGIFGSVRPYDASEVLRWLSPTAVLLDTPNQLQEIYQDGERFWLVDDRWGMTEINLLKNTFRSWVLPKPTIDPVLCAEMAVMWPLSQLLRGRDLFLLPAVSVVRQGWGLLLISPFSLVIEIDRLARCGFQIIGPRWTALRPAGERMEMLRMPGRMEQPVPPRYRPAYVDERATPSLWVDLGQQYCGIEQAQAFCDVVLTVRSPRRLEAGAVHMTADAAVASLRRHWPITELHPQRRRGHLPVKLARSSRCYEVTLSRQTDDLLVVLDSLRRPRVEAKLVA